MVWGTVGRCSGVSEHLAELHVPTPRQPPETGKTFLQRQTGTGEPLGWPRRLAELPDSSGRNVALISDSHQLAEPLSSKPHEQADFLKTACFKAHANVLKGVVYKQNPVPWEPSVHVPIHSLAGHATRPIGPTVRIPHMELTGRDPS